MSRFRGTIKLKRRGVAQPGSASAFYHHSTVVDFVAVVASEKNKRNYKLISR